MLFVPNGPFVPHVDVSGVVVDLHPKPATADGSVRSPCLPDAAGEAWIAAVGTPLPERADDALPEGYRYAGAVGVRPQKAEGTRALLAATCDPLLEEFYRPPVPAIRLVFPDGSSDVSGPSGDLPDPRAEVHFHDAHLLGDYILGRRFVLVVDDFQTGGRVALPRVQPRSWDFQVRPGECSRLIGGLDLLANDVVGGWGVLLPPQDRGSGECG